MANPGPVLRFIRRAIVLLAERLARLRNYGEIDSDRVVLDIERHVAFRRVI